jgi:alcohol dehydrogenase (NADP+)
MKKITFRNGDQMPILGLGTWKSKAGEVYQAVLWAIEAGYRHIDCASVYNNEKEVGKALQKAFEEGLVKREELFITSKLWNSSHRREDVKPALKQTLKDLQLDYLDLYLIHWPISFKSGVGFAEIRKDFYTYSDVPIIQTWVALEEVKTMGLAKHIGVSNFNIAKLEEVLKNCTEKPEMNQVEMHPYLPQNKLVNFCRSNGIQMIAYSPLGSGDRSAAVKKADEPLLLEDKKVLELAEKHGCSAAQILIAYSISREIVVIPKSTNKERIKQNFEATQVKLDEGDIEKLSSITTKYRFIDGRIFTGANSPYSPEDLWESD